jgi:hypothetical protein
MLAMGDVLHDRYVTVRALGHGPTGAVYEAQDQRLANLVALKEIRVEGEALHREVERMAHILAGIHHPSLPEITDYFRANGAQVLVMAYCTGETLAAQVAEQGGPSPVEQVLSWGDQILATLDFLHTYHPPVLHGDVKPQNLKLDAQGNAVLLDWGLVRGNPAARTAYVSPYAPLEQVQGASVGPRSDLYSLAATLYFLLTATEPPDALVRAAAIIDGRPDPLRPAHLLNPEVPSGVSELLTRAMAQNPGPRPTSAALMRQALVDATQGNAPPAIPPPVAPRTDLPTDTLPGGVAVAPVLPIRTDADAPLVPAPEVPDGEAAPRRSQAALFFTTFGAALVLLFFVGGAALWAAGRFDDGSGSAIAEPSPTATERSSLSSTPDAPGILPTETERPSPTATKTATPQPEEPSPTVSETLASPTVSETPATPAPTETTAPPPPATRPAPTRTPTRAPAPSSTFTATPALTETPPAAVTATETPELPTATASVTAAPESPTPTATTTLILPQLPVTRTVTPYPAPSP